MDHASLKNAGGYQLWDVRKDSSAEFSSHAIFINGPGIGLQKCEGSKAEIME